MAEWVSQTQKKRKLFPGERPRQESRVGFLRFCRIAKSKNKAQRLVFNLQRGF